MTDYADLRRALAEARIEQLRTTRQLEIARSAAVGRLVQLKSERRSEGERMLVSVTEAELAAESDVQAAADQRDEAEGQVLRLEAECEIEDDAYDRVQLRAHQGQIAASVRLAAALERLGELVEGLQGEMRRQASETVA